MALIGTGRWHLGDDQVVPMTRHARAASTISWVIVCNSLTLRIRPIWVNRRWSRRKLPRGDADHGRDRFLIGKILGRLEHQVEFRPVMGEDELHFLLAQGTKGMRKADTRIELRIAGQALFQTRHADQDQPKRLPVIQIAKLFQAWASLSDPLHPRRSVHSGLVRYAASCSAGQTALGPPSTFNVRRLTASSGADQRGVVVTAGV